jgi:acyl-CoA synthetase (NDP forming)
VAVEPILRTKTGPKPLAAFLTPQADKSLTLLARKGIPAFRTPEACADALATFFRWKMPREASSQDKAPANVVLPANESPDESDALALFASLGVPVAASATAVAPGFAHDVAYPVVAKVRSPDIAHKTEAGGVLLNIGSAAEFAARVPDMLATVALARPQAKVAGVLVQHMEKGLAEVIVGYRHDPMVGPVVMVGAGGTLAEIYKDYALRIAPVSEAEAAQMITEVRGLATIRGYRNLPPGDVAALARAVAAFSRLASLPGQPIVEAEINPLLVKREGVVAVDGLVVLGIGSKGESR